MKEFRVIPILLLSGNGFVKTKKFKHPVYLGDSINTIKIFNTKGVDELVILDINASKNESGPNFNKLLELTTECFIPISYGGGIRNLDDASRVLNIGYEKVILNSYALKDGLVSEISKKFGSSSTVVCVDYKKKFFGGYSIHNNKGFDKFKNNIIDYCKFLENEGAGELILQSIDRDGMYSGYDTELINLISSELKIPVICAGGASDISDFPKAIQAGASAVSAGSIFVFKGRHRAVLINYPERKLLMDNVFKKL